MGWLLETPVRTHTSAILKLVNFESLFISTMAFLDTNLAGMRIRNFSSDPNPAQLEKKSDPALNPTLIRNGEKCNYILGR